jgi:hypothetical protein
MRWRMMVAEETQCTVGDGGATTALTTMTKINNQQGAAAKADNNDSWRKAGHGG